MEGKLYTAQEIFDALQTATESLYDDDDVMMSLFAARVGSDIACKVMVILKFDEQKTIEYCHKKMKEKEREKEREKEEN